MRNKEQRYKQNVITICCTNILGKTLLDKWCKSLVAEQELVFTNNVIFLGSAISYLHKLQQFPQ